MGPPILQFAKRLPRKVVNRLTVWMFVILLPLERILYRYSLVGHTEFIDKTRFNWVAKLEEHWPAIRRELDEVLRHPSHIPNYAYLSEEARDLTAEENWKTFIFYAYGVKVPFNCERCPATAALLQHIEGLKSAFFSIMLPGTHLQPHRGHYAGVLRYHLGLVVPDVERCRIRVGSQVAHWEEGRSLIFDDTFEHEVWNDCNAIRVVLFVDFARPLPFPLSRLNDLMIWLVSRSSVIQPGIAKLKEWNKRYPATP